VRTFSFGGGVQSTAVLALQALGELPDPYEAFLFSNVGDDSEDPLTIEYFNKYHIPFAEEHGINLIELRKQRRGGEPETLWEQLHRTEVKSIQIPSRRKNGAPGGRKCTRDYKIRVIRKWQRKNGSSKDNPAYTGLGISVDEIQRARTASGFDDQILEYPLIDLGMSRDDCFEVIERAGLPRPPRSACFFCPFHNIASWRELKIGRPELFEKAAQLEDVLLERNRKNGKEPEWLSRYAKPLREAFVEDIDPPDAPDGPESCDSGSCWT
jgi:hypothetical protein